MATSYATGGGVGKQTPVVFVPGGINPAAISYGKILEVLKDEITPLLKDHELYAREVPPPDWNLGTEVEAIRRAADSAGFSTFHLVGYSGGGAISLVFTTQYPQRLRSLTLIEPAWIGNEEWTPEEKAYWSVLDRIEALEPDDYMREFMRNGVRPGVALPPPPPGPPPPWMARRPAGLRAFMQAFKSTRLDYDRLRLFTSPVYVAVGNQSNIAEQKKAERLIGICPDCRVEVYKDTHHFAPPQREQPAQFAESLRDLWGVGEARKRKVA